MKNKIVVDGITYYREPLDLKKAKEVLDKYEWIKSEIRYACTKGEEAYHKKKDDGLSVGAIEAEGYLRCANDLASIVIKIEQTMSNMEYTT